VVIPGAEDAIDFAAFDQPAQFGEAGAAQALGAKAFILDDVMGQPLARQAAWSSSTWDSQLG
jgi:hypothetical protein